MRYPKEALVFELIRERKDHGAPVRLGALVEFCDRPEQPDAQFVVVDPLDMQTDFPVDDDVRTGWWFVVADLKPLTPAAKDLLENMKEWAKPTVGA